MRPAVLGDRVVRTARSIGVRARADQQDQKKQSHGDASEQAPGQRALVGDAARAYLARYRLYDQGQPANAAVTVLDASTTTSQCGSVPQPLWPLQPVKLDPLSGLAVSVTTVPPL